MNAKEHTADIAQIRGVSLKVFSLINIWNRNLIYVLQKYDEDNHQPNMADKNLILKTQVLFTLYHALSASI